MIAVLVGVALFAAVPAASAASRDRRAPRVSIAAPTANATLDGVVTVAGSSSDNVRVKKIAVGIDGAGFVPASGTTDWSLPLDSAAYADGAHTVVVKAWDRRGNVGKTKATVVFDNGVSEPSSGPTSTTTPEGTRIEVDSAGPWTADQIAAMLQRNGLDSTVGSRLTVRVQDSFPSQVTTSASKSGDNYTSINAIMYLKGVNSSFASTPESIIAHEYGHAWSLYHLYMSQQGDWSSYLEARGLDGDSRVDSAYEWGTNEIIADDYRILFGTADAAAQHPHLNSEIPDPRDVPGLRAFLADAWTS